MLNLINDIQLVGDADTKLKNLGQIREILTVRSPNLLGSLGPYVFELMLDPSVRIRKFLLQFSGEALSKDKSLVANVVNLYNYYMSDSSEVNS